MNRPWTIFQWLWMLAFLPSVWGQTNTQVQLFLSADEATPGTRITAAVVMKMNSGWHTYWRNAGDSGMATEIDWNLPPSIKAGEIQWPVPEKYTAADLTTYVYHNEVWLLIPLEVQKDAPPGPATISAAISWLECEKVCVPGETNVQAQLVIGSQNRPSPQAADFDFWRDRIPTPLTEGEATAQWAAPASQEETRPFTIRWTLKNKQVPPFDFYPFAADDFDVTGKTEPISPGVIKKEILPFEDTWPDELNGLLVAFPERPTEKVAYEVKLKLAPASASASTSPSDKTAPAAPAQKPGAGVFPEPETSIALMLFYGFLGGLILNLMPCVLPVIALKVLGFVNQSKEEPGRMRALGLVFGAGVLLSFLLLAGLVIAIKEAGDLANWGMQFQNPYFLVVMTILVLLIALNLFGLFDINLGQGAMGTAGELASRGGYSGAFFNGFLATILATPCTAPFLGTAIGFAFLQPSWIIAVMFLAIGLGLALPYVLLSFFPRWLSFVPKPGPWMEKLKVGFGFPMLAVAIWLFYLTAGHYGAGGILWIGMFLVVVAFAAWIWGEFAQRERRHRTAAMVIALAILLIGYAYTLEAQLKWRSNEARATRAAAVAQDDEGIPWKTWSPEAVAAARAKGHPVLVDFTADWCLTCQLNKKTSLEIDAVERKLKEINAVAFLADYTLKNPQITEELKKYQRAGVPLVLVFPADADQPPIVLPEFLTPSIVLEALDAAANPAQLSHAD